MFVTNAERRRFLAFELRKVRDNLWVSEKSWDRYSIYIMNTDEDHPKTFEEWFDSQKRK